ncbi:AbiEi antitoxin N-terminal domain-containing protein [Rhizobium rhizophilum]|uniref:AbiEi antitoxin N-terminal domain-containing protein n=1 Tax=Rhizobium rhizophilum TaxID=1850373 RepID=UPI001F377C36|nr:AbiEi antitoxin N-terminal domain-containing protein [Rhizobium rhizophilum]
MAMQTGSRLNRLEKDLSEGLVVDAAWLEARGIASNLRACCVKAGWLEQPVRSVSKRPRGTLKLAASRHHSSDPALANAVLCRWAHGIGATGLCAARIISRRDQDGSP